MENREEEVDMTISERFQFMMKIGNGAYGHVWKVKEKSNNRIWALKKIYSAFQNSEDAQRTYREVAILRSLKHPNIIKLKEVIKSQNNEDLYLLLEYMQCDLYTAIVSGILNENQKKYIVYQINNALHYLHSVNVIHRDIKPSNILLDEECQVKICDFGLATVLDKNKIRIMTQHVVTRWYRPPQILFGASRYDQSADIWSFGCLIYELFTGVPLLPGQNTFQQVQKIIELKGYPNEEDISALNVLNLTSILSQFKVQHKNAFSFFELQNRQLSYILITNLLQYNPSLRWNTLQIYNYALFNSYRQPQHLVTSDQVIKLKLQNRSKYSPQQYRTLIYLLFEEVKIKKKKNRNCSGSSLSVENIYLNNQTILKDLRFQNRRGKNQVKKNKSLFKNRKHRQSLYSTKGQFDKQNNLNQQTRYYKEKNNNKLAKLTEKKSDKFKIKKKNMKDYLLNRTTGVLHQQLRASIL